MVRLINRDPVLATQLLRIVNSPICALVRPVSSIKDAVVLLGLVQVRKWIVMMSMLNDSSSSVGAVNLILTRARACENYAAIALSFRSDQAFLIGLLSGVRQLFGIDENQFLSQVPLQKILKKRFSTIRDCWGRCSVKSKPLNIRFCSKRQNFMSKTRRC